MNVFCLYLSSPGNKSEIWNRFKEIRSQSLPCLLFCPWSLGYSKFLWPSWLSQLFQFCLWSSFCHTDRGNTIFCRSMREDNMELLCDDDEFPSECSDTEHCQNTVGTFLTLCSEWVRLHLENSVYFWALQLWWWICPCPQDCFLIAGIAVRNLAFVSWVGQWSIPQPHWKVLHG